jgi:hypothetical protein
MDDNGDNFKDETNPKGQHTVSIYSPLTAFLPTTLCLEDISLVSFNPSSAEKKIAVRVHY